MDNLDESMYRDLCESSAKLDLEISKKRTVKESFIYMKNFKILCIGNVIQNSGFLLKHETIFLYYKFLTTKKYKHVTGK